MNKAKDVILMKNGKVVNHQSAKLPKSNKEAQETKPQKAKTPAEEIEALKAEVNNVASGLQAVTKEVAKLTESQAVAKKFQELNLRLAKVEEGWRQFMDQVSYSKGFYDGRLYIVSQAERILCEQTGCKTREELMSTGKLPSFWIATLVVCLDDPPNVLNLVVKEKHERQ